VNAAFMLDTDTVSFAIRGQGRVSEQILRRIPSELCMSAITVAELRYGAALRKSAKLHSLIDTVTANIAVMAFDESAAVHFGAVASKLAERGAPIGELDTLIAAHALSLELTLVTNNVTHFKRVDGLTVENWF
jgi:tRNA(fMet)-specific endonuclease VapC